MSAQTVKDFIYNTAQKLSIALNQNVLPSFVWMSLLSFKDVDGEPVEVSAFDPIPVSVTGAVSITTGAMTSTISYIATSAGTGYSIGDHILATLWWDTTNPADPAFLVAAWYNWNTAAEIAAPNMVHLTAVAEDALTDTQLRASAVPVSAASLPLPTGASTEATLSTLNGKVTACNTGAVTVSSSALPSGAATETTLTEANARQQLSVQTTQVLTTSGTSAQSSVVGANTKRVVIQASKAAWIALGSNPTAASGTVGNFYLPDGGQSFPIAVTASTTKIAAIQDSAAGKVVIIESS